MKKIHTFLLLLFCGFLSGYTQTEINTYNSTGRGYSTSVLSDYQCLGINPANLGWSFDNHKISLSFLETGITIYTNALTKNQVEHDLFNNNLQLSLMQKKDAADNFTDTRLLGQAAITWLGLSFYDKNVGGFAISIRDRLLWNTVFNNAAAQFLFLGYHASYFDSLVVNLGDTTGFSKHPLPAYLVYGGTSIQFVWYREYNFGYGRKIIDNDYFTWYAGFGLKYLVGYGSLQYLEEENGIHAYSSLGPEFNIDYSQPTPSQVGGSGVKKVGEGFGLDIGFSFQFLKKIKIGLALNDIGYIKWNGNVYQANSVRVYKIQTAGLDNYNLFNAGQLINTTGVPGDPDLWSGLESKKVNLPMNFRVGGSISIIPQIEVGFDAIFPLDTKVPGSYQKSMIGFGGRLTPIKWIEFSAGMVTGANVGVNIPAGITLFPIRNQSTTWELGVATRDISILFKNRDIMASLAFGFIRICLGHSDENDEAQKENLAQ